VRRTPTTRPRGSSLGHVTLRTRKALGTSRSLPTLADQERAALPRRSAISAHQILNNLDLGGPTINNAELRKIAYDERVILCGSIPTSVQAPNYGRAGVGAAGVVDGPFWTIEDSRPS
jgi:hypothetical protein